MVWFVAASNATYILAIGIYYVIDTARGHKTNPHHMKMLSNMNPTMVLIKLDPTLPRRMTTQAAIYLQIFFLFGLFSFSF
jgi:hypothetical protein